ncbi:MAG: hypothetical protein ACFBZ9_01255, partial [Sphingomonadales bacterium]
GTNMKERVSTHPYLADTDALALKAATKGLQKICGGQDACTEITRGSRQTHSDWSNPNHLDIFMPVDVILGLEAASPEGPLVTKHLARQAGYALVPIADIGRDPATDEQRGTQVMSAAMMKEAADVLQASSARLKKPDCLASKQRVGKELRDLIDHLVLWQARLSTADEDGAA